MKILPSETISDEQLVELYLNGNHECIGNLYLRYFNKVYRKCYSFTRDQSLAFDLTQDIMIKSINKLYTFKGKSKFSTWLFALTTNYCIEIFRKNKSIVFEPIEEKHVLDKMENEDISELSEISYSEIIRIMNEIPETDQVMLRMKYECNCSIKDLQVSFNLSASAVKMRLQRARNKIEKIYLRRLRATA